MEAFKIYAMKTALFKSSHQIPESILTGWIGGNHIRSHKNQVRTIHRSGISTCQSNIITVVIYIILLVILCESCAFTWIGRSVGGDLGKPRFNGSSDSRIVKVSSDRINYGGRNHVEVHKTDSSVLSGKFIGFKPIPEIHHVSKYNQYLDSMMIQFPKIGNKLVVSTSGSSDRNITGEFEGFIAEGIQILTGENTRTLQFHNIIRITDVSGLDFDVETINQSFNSDQIPTRTGVLLKINTRQKVLIPCEEIAYARCQKGERNGKLIGTAIGVLIDISITMVKSQDVRNDNSLKMIF